VPTSRPPIVVPPRALLVGLATLAASAAGAAPAEAKAPRCPSGGNPVSASWGTANEFGDAYDTVGSSYPRTGLARARRVEVRATGPGRRRLVLCADGRVRVRLPDLRARQFVTAVAVNGPWVAWAVRSPVTRARVSVGRVRHGRLRAVRRTVTATGPSARRSVDSGAFLVLADGTTAWSVDATSEPIGAVWPRGEAVVPFSRGVLDGPLSVVPRGTGFGGTITILDDRHVLLDGHLLRAYRPPVPGSCPVLTTGTWEELGGWRMADVGGEWDESTEQVESAARSVVCDPARGRHVDVAATRHHSGKGNSGRSVFGTTARNGRWLLRAVIGFDDQLDATAVTITDPATGERHVAAGHLDVAGLPPVVETPPATVEASATHRGAAAVPGATAWIERADAPGMVDTVWLSDGNGTRPVGSAVFVGYDPGTSNSPWVSARRSIRDLALSAARLSWTASDGTTSTHAVSPIAGEPFATRAAPAAR
jgi:hypothetical protein